MIDGCQVRSRAPLGRQDNGEVSAAGEGRYYRTYLVCLLAAILALNGLDGTALGLVLPNIKIALHLTDTELGVLTGIAFSLFYSTAGIPLGRWADRGDRVAIIVLTTSLWGVMVMLVGAARSFVELLILRAAVAVGEAGCVPAAYSLIGDYFPREERPRAVASYLAGTYLSLILGYLGAGWLSAHYGWRTMFVCIGAPSVLVAAVAGWTLAEPRRLQRQSFPDLVRRAESVPLLQAARKLWRIRTFRYLLAALCVNFFFGSGQLVWQPSFFARSYGMKAEQLGLYFALIYGAGGLLGTYCGGHWASRYAPNNERLQLRAIALFNAGLGVLSAFIYLVKDPAVSMSLLGLGIIGSAIGNGPVFATIQTVVPERMRAISISLIYLFANLLGTGLGPLLVGGLSDALHAYFGAESLRYALLAMCPGYLVGGAVLWAAARMVLADAGATGDPRTITAFDRS